MYDPPSACVENEIECYGQGEEAYKVQSLVGLAGDVGLCCCGSGRQRRMREQAEGRGEDQEDEKGDCCMDVSTPPEVKQHRRTCSQKEIGFAW